MDSFMGGNEPRVEGSSTATGGTTSSTTAGAGAGAGMLAGAVAATGAAPAGVGFTSASTFGAFVVVAAVAVAACAGVGEGAQLGSAIVLEIRRDGVLLDVSGRRVLLPRP
jgi:hypothetical protein